MLSNAYSPLAAGFLIGSLTFAQGEHELRGTRFEINEATVYGNLFRTYHDKPSMRSTVHKMAGLCKTHGVSMYEAAVR